MANPAGDQGQFTYSINGGSAQPFSAAALDSNSVIIDLTTSGTAIAPDDTVTVSYTAGSVTSAAGGILATFSNQPVTNNVVPYLAISPNEVTIPLTLQPGQTTNISSLGITVSANEKFQVTVADNTGRGSNLGYMGNYTGNYPSGAYDTFPLNTVLGSPLAMAGTTNGTTVAYTITPPITSGSLLYSGSAAVTNQFLYPNTFTQPVSARDLVMPTGSIYRIDLQFTISAT